MASPVAGFRPGREGVAGLLTMAIFTRLWSATGRPALSSLAISSARASSTPAIFDFGSSTFADSSAASCDRDSALGFFAAERDDDLGGIASILWFDILGDIEWPALRARIGRPPLVLSMGVPYLIVDTRERVVIPFLADSLDKYGYRVHQINTGDFVICSGAGKVRMCIERKTLEDFAASFKDGRYENRRKMIEMRRQTGCQLYFIIEGPAFPSPSRKFARIPYANILAAITSLMVRDEIFIVFSSDPAHTAERLHGMLRALEAADAPAPICVPKPFTRPCAHPAPEILSDDSAGDDVAGDDVAGVTIASAKTAGSVESAKTAGSVESAKTASDEIAGAKTASDEIASVKTASAEIEKITGVVAAGAGTIGADTTSAEATSAASDACAEATSAEATRAEATETATAASAGPTTESAGDPEDLEDAEFVIPDGLLAPIVPTAREELVVMWSALPGISIAVAKVLSQQFSFADLACGRVESSRVRALRSATGRALPKQAIASLMRLLKNERAAAISVVAAARGLTAATAGMIVDAAGGIAGLATTSAAGLATTSADALADVRLQQKNRSVRFGKQRAAHLLELINMCAN